MDYLGSRYGHPGMAMMPELHIKFALLLQGCLQAAS